ncbi:MAG: UbiA family prenyltransferase [Patescibacteria group bacterium]
MFVNKNNLSYYIEILRPSYWFKNFVVYLGGLASIFYHKPESDMWFLFSRLSFAFILACLISSVNYIVNGLADEKTDSFHPLKGKRAIPNQRVSKRFLYGIMFFLLLTSSALALIVFGQKVFQFLFLLFLAGLLYNLKPIRLKDRFVLDVISESVNNPLRILIGWFAVRESFIFPPLSFLFLFWTSGAILMSTKRYAELKFLSEKFPKAIPFHYRNSYRYYRLGNIFLITILYFLLTLCLFGYFAIIYKPRLLLALPLLLFLFIWLVVLMEDEKGLLKEPENLFFKKPLFSLAAGLILLILIVLLSSW